MAALTLNTCARLGDLTDHTVLLTNPTLRVHTLTPLAAPTLTNGLQLDYHATLEDGNGQVVNVALRGEAVKGHECVNGPSDCTFTNGAIITVQRMLRLPPPSNMIYVHDVEVFCQHQPLTLQQRLHSVQVQREKADQDAQAVFQRLVDVISPTLGHQQEVVRLMAELQIFIQGHGEEATRG